jgi:hypothetical protein
MWGRIKKEPAMVIAALQACIALGAAFGLKLSADQLGAVTAACAAVLGLVTRSMVSPCV